MSRPSTCRLVFNTMYCLLCLLSLQVFTFGLYSQALDNQMGYSTLGTQFVYNFGLMGYAIGTIIAGTLLEVGGPKLTLSIGAVLGAVGFVLSGLAVDQYFYCPEGLFWLFSFLTTLGQGFAYITAVVTNANNFTKKYRGKIVGVSFATTTFNSILMPIIWDNLFVENPDVYDRTSQRLSSYFYVLGIFMGGSLGVGALVVKQFELGEVESTPQETSEGETVTGQEGEVHEPVKQTVNEGEMKNVVNDIDTSKEPQKLRKKKADWRILFTSSYIALLITHTCWRGVDKTYVGDLGKIGESLRADNLVATHVMLQGVFGVTFRIVGGDLLDRYRKRVPAWIWLEVGCGVLAVMLLLFIFFLEPLYRTYMSTIGFGFGAINNTIMSTTVANRFGVENMANGWSVILAVSTLATFAYGGWNSAIYDNQGSVTDDGLKCYGENCFRLAFIIALGTMLFGMVILAWKGRDSQYSNKSKEIDTNTDTKSTDEEAPLLKTGKL